MLSNGIFGDKFGRLSRDLWEDLDSLFNERWKRPRKKTGPEIMLPYLSNLTRSTYETLRALLMSLEAVRSRVEEACRERLKSQEGSSSGLDLVLIFDKVVMILRGVSYRGFHETFIVDTPRGNYPIIHLLYDLLEDIAKFAYYDPCYKHSQTPTRDHQRAPMYMEFCIQIIAKTIVDMQVLTETAPEYPMGRIRAHSYSIPKLIGYRPEDDIPADPLCMNSIVESAHRATLITACSLMHLTSTISSINGAGGLEKRMSSLTFVDQINKDSILALVRVGGLISHTTPFCLRGSVTRIVRLTFNYYRKIAKYLEYSYSYPTYTVYGNIPEIAIPLVLSTAEAYGKNGNREAFEWKDAEEGENYPIHFLRFELVDAIFHAHMAMIELENTLTAIPLPTLLTYLTRRGEIRKREGISNAIGKLLQIEFDFLAAVIKSTYVGDFYLRVYITDRNNPDAHTLRWRDAFFNEYIREILKNIGSILDTVVSLKSEVQKDIMEATHKRSNFTNSLEHICVCAMRAYDIINQNLEASCKLYGCAWGTGDRCRSPTFPGERPRPDSTVIYAPVISSIVSLEKNYDLQEMRRVPEPRDLSATRNRTLPNNIFGPGFGLYSGIRTIRRYSTRPAFRLPELFCLFFADLFGGKPGTTLTDIEKNGMSFENGKRCFVDRNP